MDISTAKFKAKSALCDAEAKASRALKAKTREEYVRYFMESMNYFGQYEAFMQVIKAYSSNLYIQLLEENQKRTTAIEKARKSLYEIL